MSPEAVRIHDLIERYDALLLDAYGVLVTGRGVLPGAVALIDRLNRIGKPYWLVTNDASRLPETLAAEFAALGLAVEADRIVSSGSLLAGWIERHGLAGERIGVMGPPDSHDMVARAGGQPVSPRQPFAALAVCDESGYPFLEGANAAFSTVCRRLDRGFSVPLALPNPDLVYPRGGGDFAFTAGGFAAMIGAALRARYPDRQDLEFEVLGKPRPPIFEEGVRRAGTRHVVMIGDQIATDVVGAQAAGLDAALLAGGVSGRDWGGVCPQFTLATLE
jgi:ribonucleotide monophosphatase NagD (HAD superfamily)